MICKEEKLCFAQASRFVETQVPVKEETKKWEFKESVVFPEYNELIPSQ